MKIKKMALALLTILWILAFAAGCVTNHATPPGGATPTPTATPAQTIDTPLEVYDYFYDSMVMALSHEAADITYTTGMTDNTQAANPTPTPEPVVSLFKKSGGVVYNNGDDAAKAYYNNRGYYGANYGTFADITLKQFISVIFNNMYEVEMECFLFATDITFAQYQGGYKLTAEAWGYPHVYTMELITDSDHAMISAHIESQVMTFTRDFDISVDYSAAVTGVPLPTALPLVGTDSTADWVNFFEVTDAVYAYSVRAEMKKNYYEASGLENYGNAKGAYRVNATRGLFTLENGFSYYTDGKLYQEDMTLSPDFNQRYYAEMPINNVKYLLMRDAFHILSEQLPPANVTKNVQGNTVRYDSPSFYCILTDGVLDTLVGKAVYSEVVYYDKHQFFSEVETISAPGGFVADNFIPQAKASDLSNCAWVLSVCQQTLDNKYNLNGTDPENFEYANALDSLTISVSQTEPEIIAYGWYYIRVRPATATEKGEILAIYYKGEGGTYRVYEEGGEVLYEDLEVT